MRGHWFGLLVAVSAMALGQVAVSAQIPVWQMQESGTTAGLRGIWALDSLTVWVSGSKGTVLRTVDGGEHWLHCAIPDAAKDGATLDFGGIRAWDPLMAIVMASGPGDKSRLYKTNDGCRTWKLIFRNPDSEGFWDAIRFDGMNDGIVLGDPVKGTFAVFITVDGGATWRRQTPLGLEVDASKQAVFAASNGSLLVWGSLSRRIFVTGGQAGAHLVECHGEVDDRGRPEHIDCLQRPTLLPLANGNETTGAFAIDWPAVHCYDRDACRRNLIAVGGNYAKPNDSQGTAAWSSDGGEHWTVPVTPPHGYRSTVEFAEWLNVWITAGTNGSDVSRDDGRTWTPLDDGNWNALSLPFVVGPNGRIGRLNAEALRKKGLE